MRDVLKKTAATLRLMVGVGDYEAYVKHWVEHHPNMEVLTRESWYRERVDARYGGKKGINRCPC